ncbi:Imm45 family immunity protein [Variovorax beijingensis]|nr:Imm45 family immunity protein [Variovorax beijingensis]
MTKQCGAMNLMQTKGAAVEGAIAEWSKLLEWEPAALFRGTVFRCNAVWPYENIVDFMLVELPNSPSGLSVIVVTGYKAGLVLVHLPAEARSEANARALSTAWVVENWGRWIYSECPAELVQVLENYPAEVHVEGAPSSPSRDLKL